MLIAIANTYVTRQQSSQKLQNLEDTGLLTKTKPHSRRPSPYAAGKKEVWGISFSPYGPHPHTRRKSKLLFLAAA